MASTKMMVYAHLVFASTTLYISAGNAVIMFCLYRRVLVHGSVDHSRSRQRPGRSTWSWPVEDPLPSRQQVQLQMFSDSGPTC